MKRTFCYIFLGCEFLFSIFILFGAMIEHDILAKIIYIIAALLICPFKYILLKKVISKKYYIICRIVGLFFGLVLVVVSTVFFADMSIDEKMVVNKGIIYIENRYSKYDQVSINGYEISEVEEKGEKKILKLKMDIVAKKDSKEEKREEICYVGYNEKTLTYTFENYK